jgi:hypothetical protein
MSSKKSLGMFGFLGLVCLVLGALVVGLFLAKSYGLIETIPWAGKDENRLVLIVNAGLGLPAAAAVFGFLGMKFADSGGSKAKCLGILVGGLALLGAMLATSFLGKS